MARRKTKKQKEADSLVSGVLFLVILAVYLLKYALIIGGILLILWIIVRLISGYRNKQMAAAQNEAATGQNTMDMGMNTNLTVSPSASMNELRQRQLKGLSGMNSWEVQIPDIFQEIDIDMSDLPEDSEDNDPGSAVVSPEGPMSYREKYDRQPLENLEALVEKTNTSNSVMDVYHQYALKIKQIVDGDVTEKYFAGQSAVSFYVKAPTGKSRKLCEIKLNKTSMTLFLIYETDSEMIEKIEQIRSGIQNSLGRPLSKVTGIKDMEKFDEISDLIQLTYDQLMSSCT